MMLGRNLLVMYQNVIEGQYGIDYKGCLAFLFFLSTIVRSLI
jgi:hypothetical protein